MIKPEQIVKLLQGVVTWIKYWLWVHPIENPIPEKPIRVKAEQVFDDYTVIVFDGQMISLNKAELALWNNKQVYPRKDKRATARKFREQERKGLIRFEKINGKMVCLKNKDYNALADKKKAEEHGV